MCNEYLADVCERYNTRNVYAYATPTRVYHTLNTRHYTPCTMGIWLTFARNMMYAMRMNMQRLYAYSIHHILCQRRYTPCAISVHLAFARDIIYGMCMQMQRLYTYTIH